MARPWIVSVRCGFGPVRGTAACCEASGGKGASKAAGAADRDGRCEGSTCTEVAGGPCC